MREVVDGSARGGVRVNTYGWLLSPFDAHGGHIRRKPDSLFGPFWKVCDRMLRLFDILTPVHHAARRNDLPPVAFHIDSQVETCS